jgi:hypothetical protein
VKLAGIDLTAIKIVGILCFGLALLAIFRLLFRTLPFGYCLAVIASLGFNPFLWRSKDTIGSDLPFLCFFYVAFALLQECDIRQWLCTRRMIVAGVAIYVSFALRTVGGILLPVLVVYALLRLRRIPRGVWIILITAGLLIAIHSAATRQGSLDYMDSFPRQPLALYHALLRNVMMYLWTLRTLFFPLGGGRFLSVLFCTLLGCCCAWGYAVRVRSGPTILEIFAAFYLALILVLPWGAGRYLIPLVPLGLMYIACAVRSLPGDGKWNTRALGAIIVAGGVAGSCLTGYTAMNRGPIRESFGNPDFMSACEFLKRNTPADAVVICRKPRLSSLVSGRRSSGYEPEASDEQLLKWFNDCGARYVLTSPALPDDRTTLVPLIERHRHLFRSTFRSGDFEIYEIGLHY